MAGHQGPDGFVRGGGIERHGHQVIVDFGVGPVLLMHADDPATVRRDHRVRITVGASGCGRGRDGDGIRA